MLKTLAEYGWAQAGAADLDAKVVALDMDRRDRMVDPFVVRLVEIELGAEGAFVHGLLGALVDDGALGTREGQFLGIGFEEILADFGTDVFEEKAEMRQHRVVAADGLAWLQVIDQSHQRQRAEHQSRPQP
jgi:hypothetical protein